MDYSRFRLFSFDCYGTLIDWETGIWDALQRLFLANDARAPVSRAEALAAYAEEESRLQREQPRERYDRILAATHQALARRWGLITTPGLDETFAASIACWPAFADTAEALRRLRKHARLAILSNVHLAGIEATMPKLGAPFDLLCTAEQVQAYKPDAAMFDHLLRQAQERFGIGREEILHVAQSPFHDIAPARAAGIACAWVDRQQLLESGHWGAIPAMPELPQPDVRFRSLAELADDVRGLRPN